MGKAGKVIVFVFVCLVILVVLTVIKEAGGGAVMWLGALAIPLFTRVCLAKKTMKQMTKTKTSH
jgi:preprotein translocase subunit SecG